MWTQSSRWGFLWFYIMSYQLTTHFHTFPSKLSLFMLSLIQFWCRKSCHSYPSYFLKDNITTIFACPDTRHHQLSRKCTRLSQYVPSLSILIAKYYSSVDSWQFTHLKWCLFWLSSSTLSLTPVASTILLWMLSENSSFTTPHTTQKQKAWVEQW